MIFKEARFKTRRWAKGKKVDWPDSQSWKELHINRWQENYYRELNKQVDKKLNRIIIW